MSDSMTAVACIASLGKQIMKEDTLKVQAYVHVFFF